MESPEEEGLEMDFQGVVGGGGREMCWRGGEGMRTSAGAGGQEPSHFYSEGSWVGQALHVLCL